MQIEDLAPRMSPAGDLDDASRAVEIGAGASNALSFSM
jgi:hypothetical protein